jgi:hypothetical protein
MAKATAKVFISYSRHDTDFVNRLVADLEGRRFSVWIDRSAIQGGDSWRKSIVDAINACDIFLIVISPNSVSSRNVTKEISMADERGKRLVPVVIQPTQIPADIEYQLTGVQYLDFTAEPYSTAMDRLLVAMGAAGSVGAALPSMVSGSGRGAGPQNPAPQFSPVGVWQVQSVNMFGVVSGYGQLRLDGSGGFAGQFNTPAGPTALQGRWQMVGPQIVLQGTYNLVAMPFQVFPYGLTLQVTGVGPAGFSAVANTGDQCTFQRVG